MGEVIAVYVIYSVLAFVALYLYYIVVMTGYKLLKDTSWQWAIKLLVYPFLVADWLVNVFVLSVWFWELPGSRFEVVTLRLKRWRREYEYKNYHSLQPVEKRRIIFAVNVCDKLLDYFDVIHNGDHC